MMRLSVRLATAIIAAATFFPLGAAQSAELPPLPSSIKDKGALRVGTKCDYPPEGFMNASGKPTGIEVNMAHKIAEYAFGEGAKAEIQCVTTSNRVPALIGGKIDLIIATMGVNKKRAEVVDFTKPYAWSASSVLVMNESEIKTLDDLAGKKVVFVKGAWQIPWFEKHYPNIEHMRLNSVSEALQALMQNRAEAYAHDLPVQLSLDAKNDKIRMLDQRYKIGNRAAAVRLGEKDWLAFVNASLAKMKDEGLYEKWIEEFVEPNQLDAKLLFWDMEKMPKS